MMRHFLTMTDVTGAQLRHLLHEARASKHHRTYGRGTLTDRSVALVFQKPSMRTRVSFEVAATQLGGSVIYLGQEDIQLGEREPVKDVARVLSRYVDGIVVRTFGHDDVEQFAAYATVPVINGLSDLVHPCQALADLFTIEEQFGRLKGLRVCYIGDGNNVLHSLAEGCAMLGVHLTAATPAGYRPESTVWRRALRLARASRAMLTLETDPRRAVRGADIIYTDVWVSMGKEAERRRRRTVFGRYRIDQALVKLAASDCRIMHCLPAHRGEEMTDEVMEGPQSLIFEQAANRLHVQKALLVWLLNQGKTA